MSEFVRYRSPVRSPQGLAWDGATMWVTSAANGCLYAIDPRTWRVQQEFVPPFEALGITHTGSDFRMILAPAIAEPDPERDHRYVYSFSPGAGFAECFVCPENSGSFLAYANRTLYLSQAWDKKLIELDERGRAVREVQLERRPVGMTIVGAAFYLATVDDEWGDGCFDRLGIDEETSSIQVLHSLAFNPRSIAFDGEQFWTADRNHDAIVALGSGGLS